MPSPAIITAVGLLNEKGKRAKLIIWSLSILIQWDKLSNHWPHADKVYMAVEVNLSIPFQATYMLYLHRWVLLIAPAAGRVFCTLHQL